MSHAILSALGLALDVRRRASDAAFGALGLALAAALALLAAGFGGFAAQGALVASGHSSASASGIVALGFLVLALVLALIGRRALSRATRF